MTTKKAVLLINLGTPAHCNTKAVKCYLREFLMDKRVIDIPIIGRFLLVNLILLFGRATRSARAYQQVWTAEGSPLLVNSLQLQTCLAQELGDEFQVEFAMRYGEPAIANIMQKLKNAESLIIIPLFPQYSSAATGSAIEESLQSLQKAWNMPALTIINDFYQDEGYITAYAEVINQHLQLNQHIDKLIFSYHGLPERHIRKSACHASCDHVNACPAINDANRFCYRAQCYATTRAIAEKLHLTSTQYTVAFQSRLGRTPWIKPYTDKLLPELRQQGVRNIAMICPSFVADCLETLEEVNIRTRQLWQAVGGEKFIFIPCVNATSAWVKALANMIRNKI